MFVRKILFGLTVVLFTFVSSANVFAQDPIPAEPSPPPIPITYELAYPGLLPDHPMYFLKAGRDRVMSFFISHPIKKAEFNLLQADKRIHASFMLSQKGQEKIDLAQSTFSKAENYFEMALSNTEEAKRQGIDVTEFTKKLLDANRKHRQVLTDMTKNFDGKNRKKFTIEAKRLADFEKRIKDLERKK